jgi:serine/threonine-protein kinase
MGAHGATTQAADEPPISVLSSRIVGSNDEERFVMLDVLGEGGMGRVLAYQDRLLGRRVAIKLPRKDGGEHAAGALRREARVAGQLEHPSIIPIYDMGEDPDTGPFYLMRLVREPSLEHAFARMRHGQSDVTHGRLLRLFIQVCQAVEYAHSRGIIHCDLKPENVLLGSFGEVFVVDWGFAYKLGDDTRPRGGTPGFMAPEALAQNKGEIDARTDVFSLGVILYQLLTNERAFPPVSFEEYAERVAAGGPGLPCATPPRQRAPELPIPAELEELCMRALELDKAKRLGSARELASAMEAFLEGTRTRKRQLRRAEELTAEGDGLAASYAELMSMRPERLLELATIRASVPPWETGAAKEALWDADDRQSVLDGLSSRTFQAAVSAYEHALEEMPGHAPARTGLTRLYAGELERAQTRGDDRARVHFEALALEHDDGQVKAAQDRGGSFEVRCAPDARVSVRLMEAAGPRLSATREVATGMGPHRLSAGSYLANVSFDGRPDVRCAALIVAGRSTVVDVDVDDAPSSDRHVLIPGGPALVGGHESNPWAPELREVEVAAFVIDRLPVTFGEYLEFVTEHDAGRAARSERLLPLTEDGDPYWHWSGSSFSPGRVLRWGDDPAALLRLPVVGVDVESVLAFAAWRSKHARAGGRPWRLPTEWEWEKAARGADGRPYPWGHRFDSTFCKIRLSRDALPAPEAIGAFPNDESPYGVRDMAGGVAEWVAPVDDKPHRASTLVSRGGAWNDWPMDCHAGARRTYLPGERSARVGFRLVRDVTRRS